MKNKFQYTILLSSVILITFLSSCSDYTEDFPVPLASVVAKFTHEAPGGFAYPATINFKNNSIIPSRASSHSFKWEFGDGEFSTDENPSHIYTKKGDFNAKLIVYSDVDTVSYSTMIQIADQIYFLEDFEKSNLIPSDWVLVNVDKKIPSNTNYASLADSAWVVYNSGIFSSKVALGISYYNPEAAADDWMILPAVNIGSGAFLSWQALSLTTSGNYPDSYEIYISTTTQTIEGCKANGIIYSVTDEAYDETINGGTGIANREIDLSNFANKTIYVAFRLMTPSPGGDRLVIDNIKIAKK